MSQGRGRCINRLLSILRKIIPFRADDLQFEGDAKTITLNGRLFATYEWKDNTDIPIFYFEDSHFDADRIESEIKDYIRLYGYWELNPKDEFEGTTGVYSIAHEGELYKGEQIKPSSLTQKEHYAKIFDRIKNRK